MAKISNMPLINCIYGCLVVITFLRPFFFLKLIEITSIAKTQLLIILITKTLYVSAKYLDTPSIVAKNKVASIINKIPFLTLLIKTS